MIVLNNTTTLEIVLDTIPTTEFDWNVSFIDTVDDEPKQGNGVSNGTTDVTIVSSPSTDKRLIRFVSIFNADSIQHTLTIKINNGANDRIITKQNLKPNNTLIYDAEYGWSIIPKTYAGLDTKKLLVSANDTTEDHLEAKLTDNGNVSFTTENDGSNETIRADALPYTWSYADETVRLADTGFAASDVGKLARQIDSNTLWILTNHSPITWKAIGSDTNDIFIIAASRNSSNANNIYLRLENGTPMNLSPRILPFDATLVAMSAATRNAETWDAEIHTLLSPVSGAVLSIAADTSAYDDSYNIDLSAGDGIQIYCNGTGVSYPNVYAVFYRR